MSLLEGPAFLFVWIGFLLLMSLGIGAFFLWAIRAGQFYNQERARYLALQAEIPDTGSLPRRGRDGEAQGGSPEAEGAPSPAALLPGEKTGERRRS